MYLATVVYDKGNGLTTEIFIGNYQIEVEEKAINDLYCYVTDVNPVIRPPIERQLEQIEEYFSGNTDDRAKVDVFNLETGERLQVQLLGTFPRGSLG